MEIYKSPRELNSPFNKYSVSQEKGKSSPSAYFGNESKRMANLSANDYFKFVSHQIGTTPDKLIKQRSETPNEISVNDIRKKMREGTKFDTPWLRLTDAGEKGDVRPYWQEGLHRMLAAGQEYGMDTKFPIYIAFENDPWDKLDSLSMDDFIKHYDDTRLSRYNKRKQAEEEEQRAIDDFYKEETADHFGILLDQVTPELIKEYKKWEDKNMWNFDEEDL